MTYFVEVIITKETQSEKDAEEFASRVLESTKGEGEYEKKIKYYKPKTWNGTTYTVNNYQPQVTTAAESVQQKITRAAELGLLRDGS